MHAEGRPALASREHRRAVVRRYQSLGLDSERLEHLGFSNDEIASIQVAQKWSRSLRRGKSTETESITMQMAVAATMAAKVSEGDVVLAHPRTDISPRTVSLETLLGDEVGREELERDVPID